jgi:hypothetical protein
MDDRRTLAWFSAFVIVVMLIGVTSGILIDRFVLRPPQNRAGGGFGPAGGRMGSGGMRGDGMVAGGGRGTMGRAGGIVERLTRELDLTAAQKTQVDAILARRRTRLDEIRNDAQGRMQKEQADLRAEIRAVLDEKQQKRFDDVMANAPGLGGPRGQGQGPGMRRGQ